jgi:hypothetical protein
MQRTQTYIAEHRQPVELDPDFDVVAFARSHGIHARREPCSTATST